MLATPNTTISILRGSALDEFGDDEPVDDSTPAASAGVPASVVEKTRTAFLPDSSVPSIVRYTTVRVDGRVVILPGDRLRDEISGITYNIIDFSQPNSVAGFIADLRLDLERVT